VGEIMWKLKLTAAIGGLEDIGFMDDSDKLLVLSSQGLGIFDCHTGECLYRSEIDWWPLFDKAANAMTRVPGYHSLPVKVSGLHSDLMLLKKTADDWQVLAGEPEPDEPPFERFLVTKVYLIDKSGNRTFVAADGPCELRAFGFSDKGNVLVVATSCEVIIWSQD